MGLRRTREAPRDESSSSIFDERCLGLWNIFGWFFEYTFPKHAQSLAIVQVTFAHTAEVGALLLLMSY